MEEFKIYLDNDDTEYLVEVTVYNQNEWTIDNVFVSCDQMFKHAPIDIDAPAYKTLLDLLGDKVYMQVIDFYNGLAEYHAEAYAESRYYERMENNDQI